MDSYFAVIFEMGSTVHRVCMFAFIIVVVGTLVDGEIWVLIGTYARTYVHIMRTVCSEAEFKYKGTKNWWI